MVPLAYAAPCDPCLPGDFLLSFDGAAGAGVQFSDADEVATDSNNRIITGDNDIAIKVQIYDSAGNFLLSFDGSDGAGTAFANIESIAVNSTNHIFVVEFSKVQIYDSTGSFIAFFDGTNGTGTSFGVARGIAIDSDDRIIVSDAAADTIQIFDQNGFFLSTFTGSGAGGTNFATVANIATDSANRILVADNTGMGSLGTVQIFDSSGTSFVRTFNGTAGGGTQFALLTGIAVDSSDRIFVLDGGTEDTVQVFNSAGSFLFSFDGSDGAGTAFGIPNDIAIDSNDRILVIDGSVLKVQIYEGFPPTPTLLTAVWDDADNSDLVLSAEDTLTITFDTATNQPGGTGTLAKGIVDNLFTFAKSLGTDYTGVWTSTTVFTITIVNAAGATAVIGDTVSAKGTLQFTGTLDTTGGTAFVSPRGIATNSTDFIFVGDTSPDIVQIFNPDGTYSGENLDTTGGTAFINPAQIATNSTDFIFLGDANALVQIFNPDGTYSGSNLDTTGGTAFSSIFGIATNSTDHIFVGENLSATAVQIFNPDGTFAGTVDTTGGTAFNFPKDIATNSTDFIFVSDSINNNVQIFNPDGTFAGALDTTGGTAFTSVDGIATNSTDFIFVSDPSLGIVQIFNPDGTSSGSNIDTTGGTAFLIPTYIAINSRDDLFVTDPIFDIVQRFSQGIRDSTSVSAPATEGTSTTGNFGDILQINFNANLDGSQEVPPVSTTGTGTAIFKLNESGTEISFRIEITNLDLGSDVTGAHIHSAPLGVNGGIVVGFINPSDTASTIDAVAGTILGTFDTSSLSGSLAGQPLLALVNEMIAGTSYVNIHTNANSGGEIRGQIEPCLPPSSGNWVVDFDCTLLTIANAPANVIIQGGSVLTIPFGLSLDIDFTQFNLTVESGSGVLIKAGGKIN